MTSQPYLKEIVTDSKVCNY